MKVTNSTDTTTTDDPVPTPREIAERARRFMFTEPRQGLTDRLLGIDNVQKDYEHERITMWDGTIINDFDNKESRLELNDYFLKVRDLHIPAPMREGETENLIVAYVPNKRMEDTEAATTKAYNEGNYNEVYWLFQELYTATLTTTVRWEVLKEKGSQ